MVELLVTIILAGIIFAAMVPLFANALKRSAADNNRVTAANLAQERIEKARLLDYDKITTDNLNSATFSGGWFVASTTVGGKTYTVESTVTAAAPSTSPPYKPPYKEVAVTVRWSESYKTSSGTWANAPYARTVRTVIKNPAATTITTAPSPTATPTDFAVTVRFKYYQYVMGSTSYGVSIIRRVPTPVTTFSPSLLRPTDAVQTVSWTAVPGGKDITYTVQCKGRNPGGTFTYETPPFHLLSNANLKFDTYPGH